VAVFAVNRSSGRSHLSSSAVSSIPLSVRERRVRCLPPAHGGLEDGSRRADQPKSDSVRGHPASPQASTSELASIDVCPRRSPDLLVIPQAKKVHDARLGRQHDVRKNSQDVVDFEGTGWLTQPTKYPSATSPQATTAPGQENSKVSETDHPALDTTAANQRDTLLTGAR
jgi:hypothetical protein